MPDVRHNGRTLTLGQREFVAQGGQASVYVLGQEAVKIFTDQSLVPPEEKLDALRQLSHPRVVFPGATVYSPTGNRIGFAMPLLRGYHPLCRLFAKTYRQRVGIPDTALAELVLQLREVVAYAHQNQALIVDLNELNVVVQPDFHGLSVIDVDSWQIGRFPASALAESVRDRHATGFSAQTDWFAYSVVTFQLFTGIHPFRGTHPLVKGLDDRMLKNISVFDPKVVVPPMVDLDALPSRWRDWYEAVFVHGERSEPPTTVGAQQTTTPRLPGGSVRTSLRLVLQDDILGHTSIDGELWAWTATGTYCEGRRVGPAPPAGAAPLHTPNGLVFVWLEGSNIRVQEADGRSVSCGLQAEQLVPCCGDVYGRSGGSITRLVKSALGMSAQTVASVAPYATELFRGVAVTQAVGTTWVSLLSATGCVQHSFQGDKVIDGVHQDGVVILVTHGAGGWMRHTLGRAGWESEACTVGVAELVVLPTGVALIPVDRGLRIVSVADPTGARREVTLRIQGALVGLGTEVGWVVGREVTALTLAR